MLLTNILQIKTYVNDMQDYNSSSVADMYCFICIFFGLYLNSSTHNMAERRCSKKREREEFTMQEARDRTLNMPSE